MTTEQKLRSYSIGSGHPDATRIIQLERENAALEKRLQEIQRMCLGYQEEHAGLRNATLEEAAKLCDEQHDRAITSTGASRADACANRIRSLKT